AGDQLAERKADDVAREEDLVQPEGSVPRVGPEPEGHAEPDEERERLGAPHRALEAVPGGPRPEGDGWGRAVRTGRRRRAGQTGSGRRGPAAGAARPPEKITRSRAGASRTGPAAGLA